MYDSVVAVRHDVNVVGVNAVTVVGCR